MTAQEEARQRKFLIMNIELLMTRILAEVQMLKVLLVRSSKERRNRLSEIGEKVVFVTKWQKTRLNCVLLFGGKQNLQVINVERFS